MYVIVWEFVVRPDKSDDFVAAHRSDGSWAKLFARGDGYLGTELLRSMDADNAQRFLTIDRWRAAEDFFHFQQEFGYEYGILDTQLEGLTVSERKLGVFVSES